MNDIKKEHDFLISGYSGVNYFLTVDELPRVGITEIVRNKDHSYPYLGGNGINIAYYLEKLGMSPMLIIRVGEDYKEVGLLDFCEKNGIDVYSQVIEHDNSAMGYVVESKDNEHMVFFYPGAMDGKYAFKDYTDEFIASFKYVVMSVASAEDNKNLLKKIKQIGIPLIFSMKYDPDGFPKDLLSEALAYAKIIFMNDNEEKQIKRILGFSEIEELFSFGNAETIVVTLGPDGCRVINKELSGKISCRSIGITPSDGVVDTAGCGDAFVAGYLYGMCQGKDAFESAAYGNTASSFVIEHQGCLPPMPTAKELLERHYKRRN